MVTSNAESENSVRVLPFPSLIFGFLKIQNEDLAKCKVLEEPRKPLNISTKVYTSSHVQDVDNDDVEEDLDSSFLRRCCNRVLWCIFVYTDIYDF